MSTYHTIASSDDLNDPEWWALSVDLYGEGIRINHGDAEWYLNAARAAEIQVALEATTTPTELEQMVPLVKMALTVAQSRFARGDAIQENTTAMLLWYLDQLLNGGSDDEEM